MRLLITRVMPQTSRFGGITAQRIASSGFRALLRQREFRALWLADVQSLLGDQLGRVALTVLVYDRTGSGALTAGVYALTYLPALVGNLVLARWADRVPPRRLLVTGDIARALLLATMAVPAVPLWGVALLLVAAVMIGAPWKAGESALVAEILSGEGYVLGVALRVATVQGAQLVGFAGGGAAVALVGPRAALAADAATFVASAILLRLSLRERPASGGSRLLDRRGPRWSLFRVPALRVLLGYSWLAGLFIVPEGLAAPYADAIGGGATTVGLILAASPAGMLVGSVLFTRLVGPDAR